MKRTCAICAYRDGDGHGDIVAIDSPCADFTKIVTWLRCPACGYTWQEVYTLGVGTKVYVVSVGAVKA